METLSNKEFQNLLKNFDYYSVNLEMNSNSISFKGIENLIFGDYEIECLFDVYQKIKQYDATYLQPAEIEVLNDLDIDVQLLSVSHSDGYFLKLSEKQESILEREIKNYLYY